MFRKQKDIEIITEIETNNVASVESFFQSTQLNSIFYQAQFQRIFESSEWHNL